MGSATGSPSLPSSYGSAETSAPREEKPIIPERESGPVERRSPTSYENASLSFNNAKLKTRRPPTPHRRRSPASSARSSPRNRSFSRDSFPQQGDHEDSASVNGKDASRGLTVLTTPTLLSSPLSSTKEPVSTRSRRSSFGGAASSPSRPIIITQPVYTYYDTVLSNSSIQSPVGHGPSASRPRSPASTFAHSGPRIGSFSSTAWSRPFLSVNPYPASIAYSLGRGSTTVAQTYHSQELNKLDLLDYLFAFVVDTIPRQMYIHLLLRLPSLYFTRVARIFDEGDMNLYEIAALAHAPENHNQGYLNIGAKEPTSPTSPFWNLRVTWEAFISSLLEEWKTLNIVSVLLLSTILAMMQLPGVVEEPVILYSALASLICSLMSLLYGCVYIIRFGSMRKTYRAIAWAEAAQKMKTVIWWNVWVLLAMPAVWLAWSILLFVFCIMTYVWHVNPSDLSNMSILGTASRLVPRTVISALVGLGLVYFILIAITFNQYGEKVDKQWSRSMTDMRMSSFGNLSSSYEEWPASGFMASTVVTMPPTPVFIPPSISSNMARKRSRSRSPDRRAARTVVTMIPPSISLSSSLSMARTRSRSRSPDRRVARERSRTPDSKHRTEEWRGRRRSRTPVDSSPPSSEIITAPPSLASESLVIPPLRHGIPIVPRDGSMHKVVGLWFHNHDKYPMPAISQQRGLSEDQWELFVFELCAAWDGEKKPLEEKYQLSSPSTHVRPQDVISDILAIWNIHLESQHRLQAVLCREFLDIAPESSAWAVYLLDFTADESGVVPGLAERFGTVPEGLGKIVILDPRSASSNMSILAKAPATTTTIARHELETHVRFRRDDLDSDAGSG